MKVVIKQRQGNDKPFLTDEMHSKLFEMDRDFFYNSIECIEHNYDFVYEDEDGSCYCFRTIDNDVRVDPRFVNIVEEHLDEINAVVVDVPDHIVENGWFIDSEAGSDEYIVESHHIVHTDGDIIGPKYE